MNYQPSFSKGASEVLDPSLDPLGWLARAPLNGARLESGAPDRTGAEPKREPPRRRVPDCDIIYVGPRPSEVVVCEPVDVRDLAFVAPASTQSVLAARHSLAPLLFTLLILEIVVSGGIYFSKRYAESQVIFIPVPISERSVIT